MALNKVVLASGTGNSEAVVEADDFLKLCGWAVSEDAGSTAQIKIYDGETIAAGTLVIPPINCAENGFGMWGISGQGIPCHNGISVERVSGTTTVILYVDRT